MTDTITTDKCIWTRVSEFSFRKACGGRVILFAGKPADHKCVCGKQAVESKVCQQ